MALRRPVPEISDNITIWMETQTTDQRQCGHGRWLEANVEQQYRKGPDRLLRMMLTAPITINPEN